MHEPKCDINYLEKRYASPMRLPPLQPFEALRPSREHSPYLGSISLYDIGEDGRGAPELVCAFRPETYKPQHSLWLNGRLWVLGAEHVEVYDADLKSIREIRDPWLAGNHTIAATARGELIVSSSASDSVLTLNADTGEITNARRLPENFYGSNYPLGRQDSVVDHYVTNDAQLTHVNCAWPWRRGVLVSSLIQGAVGWFGPDGAYYELLRGFVGCHGARVRNDVEEIFFSDSCSGMLVFVDVQGRVIRRVGTGSRWLHDAIQIRGDLFAASPFDRNEVILLNVSSRDVISRIPCDARGGAQFLSFGVPPAECASGGDRHTRADAPAGRPGWMTNGPCLVDAALHRQRADMVHARDAMIAKHIEEIRARDATIAELDATRAREVGRRDGMLADLDRTYRCEMSARDAIIAQLQQEYRDAVGARDATLAALDSARTRDVTARDATIAELSARQAQEVGRRDALLAELGALREKERAAHDADIAELRTQIATLREERARAIASHEAIVDDLQRNLAFATRGWRRWVIGRRTR